MSERPTASTERQPDHQTSQAERRVDWRFDNRLDAWAQWLDAALRTGHPGTDHAPPQAETDRQPRLVLVPSAASVLNRAAVDGRRLDQERDAWLDETRRLLHAHQAAPGRLLLLLAEELQDQPAAAFDMLCQVLGRPVTPAPVPPDGSAFDASAQPGLLLAAQWVRADHALALTWDELLASCLPLTPDDAPTSDRPWTAAELAQALAAHGAMVRGQRLASDLELQCEAQRRAIGEWQARSDAWDDERRTLADRLDALARGHEAALADAHRTAADLASQLAGRDETLRALQQARQQSEAGLQQRLADHEAAAAAAQQALSDQLATATRDRDDQARRLAENAHLAVGLQQQVADLQAALDDARAQAGALANERSDLVAQLQQQAQALEDQAASAGALDQRRRGQIHVLEQSQQQLQDDLQLRSLQFAQAIEELQATQQAAAALRQDLASQAAAADEASRVSAQRIGELTRQRDARAAAADEASRASAQCIDELTRQRDAEAAAAEAAAGASARRIDELTRQRDADAARHSEVERQAQDLAGQVAGLRTLLQEARQREEASVAREQAAAAEAVAARAVQEERGLALEALRQSFDALRQSSDALQADHRLVQLRLAQAIEELEHMQGQHQRAERERLATQQAMEAEHGRLAARLQAAESELETLQQAALQPVRALRQLSPEPLEVVHVRDEAPHRELSLVFRDVLTPAGVLPRLLVRLVEHAGHPGLVLFRPAGGPPPLTQWLASGAEAGEEFMLLLPDDTSAASPLSSLASPNWRFVLALVETMAQEVPQAKDAGLHPHWPAIAVRLEQHFATLPSRLRYADLRATPAQDHLRVCFRDVMIDRTIWPAACLRWRLAESGPAPTLTWELDADDGRPPLISWPTRADGTFEPDYPLTLGRAFPSGDKQQWWARLPDHDRALVSAVIDALPSLAGASGVPPEVGKAAAALRHDLASTTSSMRLRHQARRLMRRVTQLG